MRGRDLLPHFFPAIHNTNHRPSFHFTSPSCLQPSGVDGSLTRLSSSPGRATATTVRYGGYMLASEDAVCMYPAFSPFTICSRQAAKALPASTHASLLATHGRFIPLQTHHGPLPDTDDRCTYSRCVSGYALRGDTTTRTCGASGWSGSAPTCEREPAARVVKPLGRAG